MDEHSWWILEIVRCVCGLKRTGSSLVHRVFYIQDKERNVKSETRTVLPSDKRLSALSGSMNPFPQVWTIGVGRRRLHAENTR